MIKKIFVGALVLLPFAAFAQNADAIVALVQRGLNVAMGLIVSFAVVYLMYGIFQFVKANGTDEREEGRNKMVYGIIGLAVMVSVWGLVRIITNTIFGSNPTPQRPIDVPPLPTIEKTNLSV